jgi:cell shape-determining protein MreC
MTYLSGKAAKKRQTIKRLLYVGFLILLTIFWTVFKSNLYPILEPVVVAYSGIKGTLHGVPQFFSTYVTSRTTIIQRNKTLEVTIENLENEIAEKNAKIQELELIKQETDGNSSNSVLVMYPLMGDITRLYSTIILSKGYKDGVEKDSYVYVRGLQPVCIIKEVYTSTSLCKLLSSSGENIEAVVESSSSSTVVSLTLTGRGGGTFLGDVARDTPVAVGDKVVMKSDHSMTLGTVVDVLHNNQDTSWHVFVRGAYNPITSSIFYLRKK